MNLGTKDSLETSKLKAPYPQTGSDGSPGNVLGDRSFPGASNINKGEQIGHDDTKGHNK